MATLKEALIGTEEQNKQGQVNLDKAAQSGSEIAKMLGGKEKPAMAKYKGTYNPDKKRGELLKDNMSTGDYFPDRKGVFVDTPGVEDAQKEADKRNAAERRSAKAEQQKPVMEEFKKTVMPFKKGGSVSSASKRADGCAIRGKTKA